MKNMRLKLSILVVALYSVFSLQAQNFGGFSNTIKWKQIETPHVIVVFPAGMEFKANRVASNIEYLISKQQSKLDFKLRKINIVLNNEAIESNGFVSSVPYYSMYFLTPPQDANMLGTDDWLDGLCTHEYHHVWQFNQMRSGLCDVAYCLFGDRGWGGYIDLIFPDWYFEGDAVRSETEYSDGGRGRLPYFSLTERAMSLDSVKYKYIKVRNGSYKDELPNHYQFGYNLLAYGQKRYGEDKWRKVVKRASNLSGILFPFSHALRKETGHGMRAFYDSMRVDFTKYTLEKAATRQVTKSTLITKHAKKIPNYYQSCYETDSTLLVLKNSNKDLLAFYRLNIKTGKESKLYDAGFLDNPWFSYANGVLVWSEFRHHERWVNKGYSIVKRLNLRSKSKYGRDLTGKTNYFSPAISPDGSEIAVVEFGSNQQCAIKTIDAVKGTDTGSMLTNLNFGDSIFASSPTFSEDGSNLIFILKKKAKLALFEYGFKSAQLVQLTPYAATAITNPTVKGNRVYFSSALGGQDDIFYVDRSDKTLHRVTTSRVGAYYPALSPNGKQLVFSNYTLKGFDLQQLNLPESSQVVTIASESANTKFYASENYTKLDNMTDSVKTKFFEVSKYNRVSNALNIHSWGPTTDQYNVGVEFVSDNILNNFSMLGGVFYNYKNKFRYASASVFYGGLYPVLYGEYTKVFDPNNEFHIIEGGGILPFDFSTAVYGKAFSIQLGYLSQHILSGDRDQFDFAGTHLLLNYQNFKFTSKQQVAPRKGVALSFDWKNGLLNNFYSIPEVTFKSEFYMPGLAKTHAIKFQLSEKTQTADGYFMDEMDYARGYERPDSSYSSYGKIGINYQLPLCYPEFGINGIFFLKRIRLNLFGDLGHATISHFDGNTSGQNFRSLGAELYFDVNWFNTYEIPFFVRYSYSFDTGAEKIPWEISAPVITF